MMHSTPENTHAAVWRIGRERELSLDRPLLMGILNVTPDSFSDGGLHLDPDHAVNAAMRMIDDGAHIIDIGGESTRPGAQRIDAAEQKRRVLPVIEQLRTQSNVAISIDTMSADVAAAAIKAGANIINDVSAAREDEDVLALAAEHQCGIVLMHRRVRPEQDSFSHAYGKEKPRYDDVVADVRTFLAERAAAAERAGIAHKHICLDPGLGFGKTVEQNYELIARMNELCETGFPVLCAASRKSFIGAVTGIEDASQRVIGSVAVSVACWFQGVRLFRIHDVAAHREALRVAAAIASCQPSDGTHILTSELEH